jgi:hypothetical protein
MAALVWLAKRPLPLAFLDGADPALDIALRAWMAQRTDGLLPPRCALDTPQLRLLLPEAEWLAPPGPEGGPAPLGRLEALAAAEAADPRAARRTLGELLREDQRTVRFTGSPLLQDIVVQGPLALERWRQLLLPTADDGVRVKELLQLCRLRESLRSVGASAGEARSAALKPRPARNADVALPAAAPGDADARAGSRAWRGIPRR